MKIKFRLLIFSTIFTLCGFFINFAQAQTTSPTPPLPPPVPKSKTKQPKEIEPLQYIFVLQLDANSNVALSVRTTPLSNNLSSVADMRAVSDFFDILNRSDSRNAGAKTKPKPIDSSIVVKADPNLNFGIIADFLRKTRKLSDNNIRLEASNLSFDPFVFIPAEQTYNAAAMMIKPNPLTLIVQISPVGKIALNNEDQGDLSDLTKLKNVLAEIFKARADNGVFREGANEVEQTVFVKASPLLKFNDVIRIADALKESGASPVGLQIDDL